MNNIQKDLLRGIIIDCQSDYTYLYEINSLMTGGAKAEHAVDSEVIKLISKCLRSGSYILFGTEDGVNFQEMVASDALDVIVTPDAWLHDPNVVPRYALLACS